MFFDQTQEDQRKWYMDYLDHMYLSNLIDSYVIVDTGGTDRPGRANCLW